MSHCWDYVYLRKDKASAVSLWLCMPSTYFTKRLGAGRSDAEGAGLGEGQRSDLGLHQDEDTFQGSFSVRNLPSVGPRLVRLMAYFNHLRPIYTEQKVSFLNTESKHQLI